MSSRIETEAFILEQLPKTWGWDVFRGFHDVFLKERGMDELNILVQFIEEQIGVYFKKISLPSEQSANNSADVLDDSILSK